MSKLTATVTETNDIKHLALEFDPASDGWFLYGYKEESKEPPALELWHMSKEDALAQAKEDYGVEASAWNGDEGEGGTPTKDCNGTILQNGDTVTLIKDLDVKGAGVTIKRGTTVKNISLTDNPEEIDCRTKEVKGLVLKTCFVKKI